MKILSWVQTKIKGKHEIKKRSKAAPVKNNASQNTYKEEFSDWPQGLLAIGTFGNAASKKQLPRNEDFQNPHPCQDMPEFTQEEVNKLEKELVKLLSLGQKYEDPGLITRMACDLPSDETLDYRPSDEILDYRSSLDTDETMEKGSDHVLSLHSKFILNKSKGLLADHRNKTIGLKSFSFHIKKMVLQRLDSAPAPCLRDHISESKMEKFLKAVLNKKIYPRDSSPTTVKKYLEKKQVDKAEIRDKILMMMKDNIKQRTEERSKWVKTDSEYIVLEIQTL